MHWKLYIVLTLIMVPFVQAEIIDERTEQFCDGNHCTLVSYGGKVFFNDDGVWKSHLDFLNEGTWLSNHDLYFEYDNGDWILYRPVIIFQDQQYIVDDLLQVYDFEWEQFLVNSKDGSKSEIRFRKHRDIDYVGMQVFSNLPIEYLDYQHILEGDWTLEDDYYINTTDLIIGEYQVSFTDLAESGFTYDYDKTTNTLWIDVRGETGIVTLDPSEQFASLSNDGYLTYTGWITPPFTCNGASDGDTAIPVGSNYISDSESWGMTPFNTSSIPDTATVTSQKVQVYVSSITRSKGYTPSNTRINYFTTGQEIGNPLSCSDGGVSGYTGQSDIDWSGTTGYKNKTLSNIDTNLTGTTTVRTTPNFQADFGKYYNYLYRSSEYTTASQRPKYFVEYTLPSAGYCNTDYTGTGDWLIAEDVICDDEQFTVGGSMTILDNASLVLINGAELTMNLISDFILIQNGGMCLVQSDTRLG